MVILVFVRDLRGIDRFVQKWKLEFRSRIHKVLAWKESHKRGPCLSLIVWKDIEKKQTSKEKYDFSIGSPIKMTLTFEYLFNQIEWFSVVRFRFVFNGYIHFYKFRQLESFESKSPLSIEERTIIHSWMISEYIKVSIKIDRISLYNTSS